MFGYCGRLRAVSLLVNRSVMFVEAVFKSTFGFSYVLFVTVVTLYHVDNVFGVAVNVMINKSSFAGRIKCIHSSKSVVYVTCKENTNEMNFKEDVRQHLHVFILITEFYTELCPGLKRVDIYSEVYTSPERRGGLTVSAPVSASGGPGSSPGWGRRVVFLAKTLYSEKCFSPPRCINGNQRI